MNIETCKYCDDTIAITPPALHQCPARHKSVCLRCYAEFSIDLDYVEHVCSDLVGSISDRTRRKIAADLNREYAQKLRDEERAQRTDYPSASQLRLEDALSLLDLLLDHLGLRIVRERHIGYGHGTWSDIRLERKPDAQVDPSRQGSSEGNR